MGWALGTFLGAVAGGLLPAALTSALGIAIYGMFLAIVLPPFRARKEIRLAVLTAVGLSCLFTYAPSFAFLTSGFRIIICAVAASALAAIIFPQGPEEAQAPPSAEALPEEEEEAETEAEAKPADSLPDAPEKEVHA